MTEGQLVKKKKKKNLQENSLKGDFFKKLKKKIKIRHVK